MVFRDELKLLVPQALQLQSIELAHDVKMKSLKVAELPKDCGK